MTDRAVDQAVDQAVDPAAQAVDPDALALPQRPVLDASSAAALAVSDELDRQSTESAVPFMGAVDVRRLADAALAGIGEFPRIPAWTGESRAIGGIKRPDTTAPDPLITVDDPAERDIVPLTVEDVAGEYQLRSPVEDVEQWALAVLAACRAARNIDQG